jgi:hypothetical protein
MLLMMFFHLIVFMTTGGAGAMAILVWYIMIITYLTIRTLMIVVDLLEIGLLPISSL